MTSVSSESGGRDSCAAHPDVAYSGGQQPLVHLEADLRTTVEWAEEQHMAWAFTNCNAGARYARFWCDLMELDQIDWRAVSATSWDSVKEKKQAEFLLRRRFPWRLVDRIGVLDSGIADRVKAAIRDAGHQPMVETKPQWYY